MRLVYTGIIFTLTMLVFDGVEGQETDSPSENDAISIENEESEGVVNTEVQELVIEDEIRVRGTIEKPGVLYLIPEKRERFQSVMNEPDFEKQLSRLRYSTVIPDAHLLEAGGLVSSETAFRSIASSEKDVSTDRSLTEALSRKLKE